MKKIGYILIAIGFLMGVLGVVFIYKHLGQPLELCKKILISFDLIVACACLLFGMAMTEDDFEL